MIKWLKCAMNFCFPAPPVATTASYKQLWGSRGFDGDDDWDHTLSSLGNSLPGWASDSLMLMPDLYSTPTEHKSIGEQGSRQHLSASGFDVGFSSFCILFFCPFLLYPRHQNLHGLLEKWHLWSGAPLSGGTEDTYRWYTMNIQCFNIIRFLFKCVRKFFYIVIYYSIKINVLC